MTKTKKQKPKPCPLCGQRPEIFLHSRGVAVAKCFHAYESDGENVGESGLETHYISTSLDATKQKVIKKWNRLVKEVKRQMDQMYQPTEREDKWEFEHT